MSDEVICSDILKEQEALDNAVKNNPDIFNIYTPYEKELEDLKMLEEELGL